MVCHGHARWVQVVVVGLAQTREMGSGGCGRFGTDVRDGVWWLWLVCHRSARRFPLCELVYRRRAKSFPVGMNGLLQACEGIPWNMANLAQAVSYTHLTLPTKA